MTLCAEKSSIDIFDGKNFFSVRGILKTTKKLLPHTLFGRVHTNTMRCLGKQMVKIEKFQVV